MSKSIQFPYVSTKVLIIAIVIVTLMIIKQNLPTNSISDRYERSISIPPMEERKLSPDLWTNLDYGKGKKGGKKGGKKNGKMNRNKAPFTSAWDKIKTAVEDPSSEKIANLKPYKYDFFSCGDYQKQCLELFQRIRNPNASLIFNPPLERIPQDMMDDFTQNGALPLRTYTYSNEAYNNSQSGPLEVVKNSELKEWIKKAMKAKAMNYQNHGMRKALFHNIDKIQGKSMAVIGTQQVWIEAMALRLNASKIVTLDYTRKKYEHPKLSWLHMNDQLDELINGNQTEVFNNVASFSSIEHTGLGRYGDPLSPNGDLDTMKQIHCMLKPNGLLFLGLPTTGRELGFLDFNLHRYYGKKRLDLMFQGWTKLNQSEPEDQNTVFILKKENLC